MRLNISPAQKKLSAGVNIFTPSLKPQTRKICRHSSLQLTYPLEVSLEPQNKISMSTQLPTSTSTCGGQLIGKRGGRINIRHHTTALTTKCMTILPLSEKLLKLELVCLSCGLYCNDNAYEVCVYTQTFSRKIDTKESVSQATAEPWPTVKSNPKSAIAPGIHTSSPDNPKTSLP